MPKDKVDPYDDAETTLVNLSHTNLDEIDYYSQELIKEDLLECSLEWIITGKSIMCNEFQIKQSAKISFERIKQIEEYK